MTFNSILDMITYYRHVYYYDANLSVTNTIRNSSMNFHIYIRSNPTTTIANNTDVNNLFSLCTSDDTATQIVICKTLRVNSGVTFTPPHRCKGMVIYCRNYLYNYGTISMTARGAHATGQNVYLYEDEYVPAEGAAGAPSVNGWSGNPSTWIWGGSGNNGTGRQTGGGGGGIAGGAWTWGSIWFWTGRGGNGTSFSGGTGAGQWRRHSSGYRGPILDPNGTDDGGHGGHGSQNWDYAYSDYGCPGGVGNPSGRHTRWTGGRFTRELNASTDHNQASGTGGLLIIFAFNLQNNGSITANGVASWHDGAGSSGGGSVNIFYGINYSAGSIYVNGGRGGRYGGNGTYNITKFADDGKYTTRVRRYVTGINSSSYSLFEETNISIESFAGTTPVLTGFTYDHNSASGSVENDTLIVDEYYTRNQYTLTINNGTGIDSSSGSGTYYYMQDATINAVPSLGYHWETWTGGETSDEQQHTFKISGDTIITANGSPNTDTKYTVNYNIQKLHAGTDTSRDYTIKLSKEYYDGVTDATMPAATVPIEGFITPSIKNIKINADGSSVIDYYYNRDTFHLTLLKGTTTKTDYLFEEDITVAFQSERLGENFRCWICENNVINSPLTNPTTFKMPAHDITVDISFTDKYRVNSNIYKNIFEAIVMDLYRIQEKFDNKEINSKVTEIIQYNHGFSFADLVYIDKNGLYHKALANEDEYLVVGIVSKVFNQNKFEITTYGEIPYQYNLSSESGILYLSDVIPGKMCSFEDITNNFYTPIGFYTGNSIILNILDSSVGDTLKRYQKLIDTSSLRQMNEQDLQYVINEVSNNAW